MAPPLSEGEAWHHYEASQAGVIDSSRFLITFTMIPSVQSGGSPLHVAAAIGNVARVRAMLESDDEDHDVNAEKATDGSFG